MKEKWARMNESVPSQLNRIDTERLKGYKVLLDFYSGMQWVGRERRGERHLTFNYAKVFVEVKTMSRSISQNRNDF